MGLSSNQWVNPDSLHESVDTFCKEIHIDSHSAGSHQQHLGTTINSVTLSVFYSENAHIGPDECRTQMSRIVWDCDKVSLPLPEGLSVRSHPSNVS